MRPYVMLLAIIWSLWASYSVAQTPVVADLDTAKFTWDWEQGTGGAATDFHVKCGTLLGDYPMIGTIEFPIMELPVRFVVDRPGIYVCIVTAVNRTTTPISESDPSNVLWIDVQRRIVLTAPGSLRVVSP